MDTDRASINSVVFLGFQVRASARNGAFRREYQIAPSTQHGCEYGEELEPARRTALSAGHAARRHARP